MSAEEKKSFLETFERLDVRLQNRLHEYALALLKSKENREKLLSFAGSFSAEDIKAFEQAENDSEKIDEDGW